MTAQPLVRCDNVIKIHKQGALEAVALQGLDLEVRKGEFLVIVGRSGSGKSTLLQLLGGMDRPSAGKVTVADLEVSGAISNDLLTHFRRNVGYAFA